MNLHTWTISGNSFHFGRHGLGQEESGIHFPSDSLFAALVAALAAAGRMAEMNSLVDAAPQLAFSSAFPRAGDVRFFPAPVGAQRTADPPDSGLDAKDLKKILYLSETLFRRWLQGEALHGLYAKAHAWQSKVLLAPEEWDVLPEAIRENKMPLWQVERQPRVTIDRRTNASTIYFTGRTVFAPGCGLWFAVRGLPAEGEVLVALERALMELEATGLGGERSSGYGQAQITPAEDLNLPDHTGKPWISLSRYLPAEDEMAALTSPQSAYAIEEIGGWLHSPRNPAQRRQAVRFLTEGSVFGPLEKAIPGQMVDVQPQYEDTHPLGHPVWRNGCALAVGLAFDPAGGEA